MKKIKTFYLLAVLIVSFGGIAQAIPTSVTYDDGRQDTLWVPPLVHELGTNPMPGIPIYFPPDEEITAGYEPTIETSCPINYDGGPNFLVYITNLTNTAWTDLWYVADMGETFLTNDDGWINGGLAFKIDYIGVNQPLVFESMAPNQIFEPGETWGFIIQDYLNVLGLLPSALGSPGVPSPVAMDPAILSSGSIIAVPAPGAILLGSIGVGLVGWMRRRRTI